MPEKHKPKSATRHARVHGHNPQHMLARALTAARIPHRVRYYDDAYDGKDGSKMEAAWTSHTMEYRNCTRHDIVGIRCTRANDVLMVEWGMNWVLTAESYDTKIKQCVIKVHRPAELKTSVEHKWSQRAGCWEGKTRRAEVDTSSRFWLVGYDDGRLMARLLPGPATTPKEARALLVPKELKTALPQSYKRLGEHYLTPRGGGAYGGVGARQHLESARTAGGAFTREQVVVSRRGVPVTPGENEFHAASGWVPPARDTRWRYPPPPQHELLPFKFPSRARPLPVRGGFNSEFKTATCVAGAIRNYRDHRHLAKWYLHRHSPDGQKEPSREPPASARKTKHPLPKLGR